MTPRMRRRPLLVLLVAGAGKLPARSPSSIQAGLNFRAAAGDESRVVRGSGSRRSIVLVIITAAVVLVLAGLLIWLLL